MYTVIRPAKFAALLVVAFSHASIAQTKTDVIKGTVTTDSGRVVFGADVYVTMAPDRVTFHANTDSAGGYSLTIPNATGDYLVHISTTGRAAVRKRLTRVAAETTFVVDAVLRSAVTQIAAVRVQASKPRPPRGSDLGTSSGGSERTVDGVVGALSPDNLGDFNAAASALPGAITTPGGFSMLGLPSSQNAVTVGGLAFPGSDIPRDARTTTRVSTSTYDPSRGWFSGATVNADLITGNLLRNARGHLTLDGRDAGQRFSNVQASYGADGPFTYEDRDFFNYSVQLSRRVAASRSLLDTRGSVLEQLGLPTDSVDQVVNALNRFRVPMAGADARVTESGSFMMRVDHAPVDLKTLAPAKTTYGATAYAKASRSSALAVSPTATPGFGARGSTQIGSVQAFYSRFLNTDYLNETRSSLSFARSAIEPYVRGPGGHVLLGTASTNDAVGSLLDLDFGGNTALDADNRGWTWEVQNETRFFAPRSPRHRLKITADSRVDGYDRTASAGTVGSFTYSSLADLESNRPSQFTRLVGNANAAGSEWNGFFAVGDFWRATPSLQIMYGGRLEANRFLSTTARNADIERAFGARTDAAPNAVSFSPRFGFTWFIKPPSSMTRTSSIGTFNVGPSAYLRGGIGEFRNLTPANLLAPAIASAGPHAGTIHLTCLGSATPDANWAAYAANPDAVPSTCAAGAPTAFVDTSRAVRFVDPSYRPPRSWRGNLAYGSTFGRLTYSVEGIYSLNLDQADFRDLNLRQGASFRAAGEGREIFAPTPAIVAGSGFVSPPLARVDNRFGAVVAEGSSARSISKQATVTVTPDLPSNLFLSASYTLASVRARQSGFAGSTFDDPRTVSWNRGDLDVRHHFVASLGYAFAGVAISGQGHVTSGLPFTPIIGSDVNGDGFVNDRAFVFAPSTSGDAKLSNDLSALVNGTDRTARRCLTSSLDRAAEQNGCQGPWNFALNAQASLSTAMLRAHRVSSINLNFGNPLGGLDALLHGNSALRGWGSINRPDPVLYRVRGFDASRGAFQYEVNPAFGRTAASRVASLNPFRITLDVSFNLGRPPAEQQMDQWLSPGRNGHAGAKLSATDLKRRYDRNVPDPYNLVMLEADSLLLSRDQLDRLAALRALYRMKIDSVLSTLSTHMAELDDRYDAAAALKYQERTLDVAWELTRAEVRRDFPTVLSQIQLSLLPGWAWTLYRADTPMTGVRSFAFGAP